MLFRFLCPLRKTCFARSNALTQGMLSLHQAARKGLLDTRLFMIQSNGQVGLVAPIIYRGPKAVPGGWEWDFWTINSILIHIVQMVVALWLSLWKIWGILQICWFYLVSGSTNELWRQIKSVVLVHANSESKLDAMYMVIFRFFSVFSREMATFNTKKTQVCVIVWP